LEFDHWPLEFAALQRGLQTFPLFLEFDHWRLKFAAPRPGF